MLFFNLYIIYLFCKLNNYHYICINISDMNTILIDFKNTSDKELKIIANNFKLKYEYKYIIIIYNIWICIICD